MGYIGYLAGLVWYGPLAFIRTLCLAALPTTSRRSGDSPDYGPAYLKAEMASAFGLDVRQ